MLEWPFGQDQLSASLRFPIICSGLNPFFANHDCSLYDFMLPYVQISRVIDIGCRARAEAILLTIVQAIPA